MNSEINFCPRCGSEDVALDGSLIEGSTTAMICKNCGYRNVNFPVKEKIKQKKRNKN
jgi:transcription elongation factor Elf1